MYSPNDEQAIDGDREIRRLHLNRKEIKNGEIVKTYDRNRRTKREKIKGCIRPNSDWTCEEEKEKDQAWVIRKKNRLGIAEKNKKERKSNADSKVVLLVKIRKLRINKKQEIVTRLLSQSLVF